MRRMSGRYVVTFTLNAGVRYEYLSPYTELHNQIANLDLSPGVLNPALGTPAVAVVLPGQSGPYSRKPAIKPGAAGSK